MSKPSNLLCLVLEDDPMTGEMISCAIREEGGQATLCPTIQAAKEAAEKEIFDLFVLDHLLPDGVGSDFFYWARESGIFTPSIMLTGRPELAVAVELTRNGLFDYLPKPFDLQSFLKCVRRIHLSSRQGEMDTGFPDLIGNSPAMKEVRRQIVQAAEHPSATILLTGETGVGKDLTARMIHQLSFQGEEGGVFIPLNCSTLPSEIFEAELFGAEKGSYTGASQTRPGLVEAAQGGTLFLDEIGEVSLTLQAKLLQLLETREYRRLGSSQSRIFEGRIMAATNKSLGDEVAAGRFRADLWYRLDVFSIVVPPLRERKEDLGALANLLLEKLSTKYNRPRPAIRPESFALLEGYSFPGNVRELRNVIERSLLQTPQNSPWLELDRVWLRKAGLVSSPPPVPTVVFAPHVSSLSGAAPRAGLTALEAQEYALIQKALAEEDGGVRRAAARLGISHQALLRRLQKWPELRRSE